MHKLLEELKRRLLLKEIINEKEIEKILLLNNQKFYIGIDPTADSMHIGHFISFNLANIIYKNSNLKPVFVIGGFTAQIGDPSGKKAERKLLGSDIIFQNSLKLEKLITIICKNLGIVNFEIFNNIKIYEKLSIIDYFKKYGKLINVSKMISRDVVKNRLNVGISYTEFSYQIFQAIDFLYLYENKNVKVQIGGSDQFTNIITGIELIHKIHGRESLVAGITVPLLVDKNNNKIGKTENNPLWIEKAKLMPYFIYQYLLNLSDDVSKKFILQLTNISYKDYEILIKKASSNPKERYIQNFIIEYLFKAFYGDEKTYSQTKEISSYLFNEEYEKISEEYLFKIFKDEKNFEYNFKKDLLTQLLENNIIKSKREYRELLKTNAIKINGKAIELENIFLTKNDFNKKPFLILSLGKKEKIVIKFI